MTPVSPLSWPSTMLTFVIASCHPSGYYLPHFLHLTQSSLSSFLLYMKSCTNTKPSYIFNTIINPDSLTNRQFVFHSVYYSLHWLTFCHVFDPVTNCRCITFLPVKDHCSFSCSKEKSINLHCLLLKMRQDRHKCNSIIWKSKCSFFFFLFFFVVQSGAMRSATVSTRTNTSRSSPSWSLPTSTTSTTSMSSLTNVQSWRKLWNRSDK